MNNICKNIRNVIRNCNIALEGKVFSKESIIQALNDFLAQTINSEKTSKTGIILHTGSVCFDAMLMIYAALTCILFNDYSINDIIYSLNEGDIVLYEREKNYFKGIVEEENGKFVNLVRTDNEKEKRMIPQMLWNDIIPYHGKSSGSNKGIRKDKSDKLAFYTEVLKFEKNTIPNVLGVSTVLLMSRERAEYLLENITLSYNLISVKLIDLVTASYYSENSEYQIGNNASKNEAVLQIASKPSVAGKLLRDRSGNKKIGIMIMGDSVVASGESEIPELIKRKKSKYSLVSFNIDSHCCENYINNYEDDNFFVCTKGFLLANSKAPALSNSFTNELYFQASAAINKETEPVLLESELSWDRCVGIKRNLQFMKNYDYDSNEKMQFIIQAYALMNLFLTSVFGFYTMQTMIYNEKLSILSAYERLNELKGYLRMFPETLSNKAKQVWEELEYLCAYAEEANPKNDYLHDFILENSDKKIAVIVPKGYYINIMKEEGYYDLTDNESNLIITTANRFNNKEIYDIVIFVGAFNGKKCNAFRCQSAKRVIVLLYEYESKYFYFHKKASQRFENKLNEKSLMEIMYNETVFDNDVSVHEDEIVEMVSAETEIDEYVERLEQMLAMQDFNTTHYVNCQFAEAVIFAVTENGEKAFFTQNYKVYIYDDTGEVKERKVSELCAGDTVLFTTNNSKTKDIVDIILKKRIAKSFYSSKVSQYYDMSQEWKTVLREYQNKNRLSANILAERMMENGVTVQKPTILGWLDEDSHTIGPRDPESIRQVAFLTENDKMFDRYIEYHNACKLVRAVRRDILKEIGKVIREKVSGKIPDRNSEFYDIHERLDSQSELLTIKSVTEISKQVPVNMVNRLIVQ